MRDSMRRYDNAQRDAKRGIGIAPVISFNVSRVRSHFSPPVADAPVKEVPMSKKEIWKRDQEGVMADAKEFRKFVAKPTIWWAISGPKTTKMFKSCDDSKQIVVTRNVIVSSAANGEV